MGMHLALALGVAGALAIGGAASAADIPVKAPLYRVAPFNWSGFYVGGNIGYGWNTSDGGPGCIDNFGIPNGPLCQIVPGGTVDAKGILGGLQAGYNWQSGPLVWGVEADFQFSNINGNTAVNGPFTTLAGVVAMPAATFLASERLDWFGTARLRAGYAGIDRLLLYVTGGLAYGRASLASNFIAPNGPTTFPASSSVTKFGWSLGAGAEYALSDRWSARLEGLYVDLGRSTTVGPETPLVFLPAPGFTRTKTFDLNFAAVRLGVNYRFGP